jgi:Domain of unknown function (DUF1877)
MGMYVQIRALKAEDVEAFLDGPPENLVRRGASNSVSLEKAWHGLHYLLTGSATSGELPLAFLLEGGDPIGEDLGYGPPRFFDHDQVAELHAALSTISDDDLWSRFDAAQMTAEGVYPGIWEEPESDLREEYLHYFDELKKIVQNAHAKKLGLLVMLT